MKKIYLKGMILPIIVAIISLLVVGVLFIYGISDTSSEQGVTNTITGLFQNKEVFDGGQDIIGNEKNNLDAPLDKAPISNSNNDEELVACTADAKICPDGSGVGRVAPNCEFAPCPGE